MQQVKNVFSSIIKSRIDLSKKARLMLRMMHIYYNYIHGIIITSLLIILILMIYRASNFIELSQILNYYFSGIFSKILGVIIVLLIIVSIIKYLFDPRAEMFYEGIGDIYFDLDKKEESENAFKQSLKHNSKRIYALRRLGDLSTLSSDYDLAIEYYLNSLKINNKLFFSWKGLGDVYSIQSRTRDAINAYKKALEIKSLNDIKFKLALLYNSEGEAYLRMQLYDKAKNSLEQSAKYDSSLHATWMLLGDLYTRTNELVQAERAYRNAISINPNITSSWIGLGNILTQQNRFSEAIEAYQEAISLDPNLATSYIGLGNVLAQQGEFQEAEKVYRKAISISPNIVSSWVGLGNVLAQQNRFKEAKEAYQNAVRLDPNLAFPWIGLGNILAQQQEYDKALEAYDIAIKRDPNQEDKLKVIRDSVILRNKLKILFASVLNDDKNNVALLLDTSSSMEGQKIIDAKEVIVSAVESIVPNHNVINLIFFGASIYTYILEPNDPIKSHDDLKERISQIRADGNTPLMGALKQAWEFLGIKENQIIIIVTDGMPNDYYPNIILDYAKSLKEAGCKIISFGIGRGVEIDEDFLREIASKEDDFHLAEVDLDSKLSTIIYEPIYQI